jgi:hypothetical protein
MNSLYDFIIEPLVSRYNNSIKVGDKTLITNTNIENYKAVSKEALVISIPSSYKTPIKIGDKIIIHHNVFRRFYDMKGVEKNSRSYFKDNMYFCAMDQVYAYYRNNKWKTVFDRCFIKPILNRSKVINSVEEYCTGVVKYDNSILNDLGIFNGDVVTFKPNRQFEILVDNERVYCMKSNDIVIKHEYKGDEEEYNPSWASCS